MREFKKIAEVIDNGEDSLICFQDRTQTEINLYQPLIFTSEKGQVQDSETIEIIDDSYRVIDGTENNWWEERQLRKHESSFSNLA